MMKFTDKQIAMLRDALGYAEAQIMTSEINVFNDVTDDVDYQLEAIKELLNIVRKEQNVRNTKYILLHIADEISSSIDDIQEESLAEGIATVLKNILDCTTETIDITLEMRAVYSMLHNDEEEYLNK